MITAGIGLCSNLCSAEAAKPFFEKQQIFPPSGTHYYHIPGLVVTAKGTVLAYCEWRDAKAHDWGKIHVALRRSTDGGKTWDGERNLVQLDAAVKPIVRSSPPKAKGQEEDITIHNPVAIADGTGPVHVLYCIEYRRVFYMRSDDEALTWSRPVEISRVFEKYRSSFDWKVIATGPGHGIQLENGRLVVPVWMAEGGIVGYHHYPSVTAVAYSDDHGASWQAGDIVARTTGRGDHPGAYHDPNESEAMQLADGAVLFNIRAPSFRHRRLQSKSKDGGTGWSAPEFIDDLPEPIDFGSIVRLSEAHGNGRSRILFSITSGQNIGLRRENFDEQSYKREDMTIFLSYDEGKTWPVKKVIESGPAGCGYSDLCVLPDGVILAAYGTGVGFGPGAGIGLARLNLEWLTDGRDTLGARQVH
jgi:sialidase-1